MSMGPRDYHKPESKASDGFVRTSEHDFLPVSQLFTDLLSQGFQYQYATKDLTKAIEERVHFSSQFQTVSVPSWWGKGNEILGVESVAETQW